MPKRSPGVGGRDPWGRCRETFIHPLSDRTVTMAREDRKGRILRVNLTRRTVGKIPFRKEW
ncbi:MAG TPA: hypothetical protein VMB35_06985, partial [Methanomicrobiales archaeon]|nr:hypothetical protein [Methanomicrobiales archaeon]